MNEIGQGSYFKTGQSHIYIDDSSKYYTWEYNTNVKVTLDANTFKFDLSGFRIGASFNDKATQSMAEYMEGLQIKAFEGYAAELAAFHEYRESLMS